MKNIVFTDSQIELMMTRFETKRIKDKTEKFKEEYANHFKEYIMLQEQECENWTCGEIQLKYQEIKRPTYSIVSAKDAYQVIKNSADMDSAGIQEHFWAIYITNNGEVIGFRTICTGRINSVEINVQLILSIALILNAQRIIIAHSHPSGNLRPSLADIDFTKRFIEASRLLSIVVTDHLIVTSDDYCSLRDAHFVNFDFVLNYYERREYKITETERTGGTTMSKKQSFRLIHKVESEKLVDVIRVAWEFVSEMGTEPEKIILPDGTELPWNATAAHQFAAEGSIDEEKFIEWSLSEQ